MRQGMRSALLTGWVCLVFSTAGGMAQSAARFRPYLDLGPYLPSSRYVRGNYREVAGGSLPLAEGLGPVPLSLGIGLELRSSDRTALYGDVQGHRRLLRSQESTVMTVRPIVLGMRRVFALGGAEQVRFQGHLGAGLGLCVSTLDASYDLTGATGPQVMGERSFRQSYLGMVIRFEAGVRWWIAKHWAVGLALSYELADGGAAERGGLGDVGGWFGGFRVFHAMR